MIKQWLLNLLSKAKIKTQGMADGLKKGGKETVILIAVAFLFMFATCLAVFFVSVQGAEKVLVPSVVGKDLTEALIELQAKELYPKIQLKYSEEMGDKGCIIKQKPDAGAIVKAYRRIELTVSLGAAPEEFLESFLGKSFDEVRSSIEFSKEKNYSLVELAPPVYRKDKAEKGTVLAQFPSSGSPLDGKTTLYLVVSSGEEEPMTEVPDIEGLSIKQFLERAEGFDVIFDITVEEDEESPAAGVFIEEERKGEKIEQYSRVQAILKIRAETEESKTKQGVFSTFIQEYPYPVPVRLEAQDENGERTKIIELMHTGKNLTLPYVINKGDTLVLYVLDEEKARQ